jgi:hypothetical protein
MPYTSKMYWQYKNLNHVRFTCESLRDGVEFLVNQQFQAEEEVTQWRNSIKDMELWEPCLVKKYNAHDYMKF